MNASYRGEGGWTNETAFLQGPRTRGEDLRRDLADSPSAVILIAQGDPSRSEEALQGVVRLQPLGGEIWELGMLAIPPALQDRGLGRSVLAAAERFIRGRGGRYIEITVLNIRRPLIAWYRRRGYRETGEVRPFPYESSLFGAPTRDDLAFVVMRKVCDHEDAD